MRQTRLVTAFCTLALLTAAPAQAIDWRGSVGFSQSFATGGGVDSTDTPDDEITSSTAFSFDFIGETPRTRLAFSPGVSLFFSTDEDFSSTDAVLPNLQGSITTGDARTRLNAAMSLTPRFVDRNQAIEGIVSDPLAGETAPSETADGRTTSRRNSSSALQIDANFNAGLSHAVDTRNSLSGGFFVRRREFTGETTGDDLQPSTSFGVNGGWSRLLTPLTSGSLSANARQFLPDGGDQADTRTFSLSAGLATQASPTLSADGSLGLSVTESNSAVEPGLVADFGFNWRASNKTSVFARLSQTVEENSDGQIDTVVSGNVGVSTELTQRASLTTTGRLSFDNPVFDSEAGTGLNIAVGPSFSYRITEKWRLNAAYSLRYETGGDDDGVSSRFTFGFGRAFDLF